MEDNKNKRKIIAIAAMLLVVTFMGVLSYAFFVTTVDNSKGMSADLTTGTMSLRFADNDNGINAQLMFGESVTKKFTIENTGTLETSLSLDWYNLINTYINGSLTYILEYSENEAGPYTKLIDTTNVPVSEDPFTLPISSEISVPAGVTYYYNLTITLTSLADVDQTDDLDAVFQTHFTVGQPSRYRYYTLVVDPAGGTWNEYTAPQSYQMKNDETMNIPEPTRVGYDFDGWNITSTAGELNDTTFTMGISNAKLTAKWKAKTYNVTINIEGGSYAGSNGDTTIEAAYGTEIELETPTREGYTFTGWEVEGGQINGNTLIIESETPSITANWQINNYKYIVYHYQMGTNGIDYTLVDGDTDEGEAEYNSTVTPATKTYTGFTSPETDSLTIKAENTYPPVLNKLEYQYTRNKYGITTELNGGTLTETIPSEMYYEASIELPIPTKTGYTFSNWTATNGSVTDNTYKMTVAEADTITANYTANTYSVIFNANGGTITGDQSKIVTYDAAYGDLPTAEYEGYKFNGWYTAQTGGEQITSETIVSITGEQTLYAQWVQGGIDITLDTLNITVKSGTPTFSSVATSNEGVYSMADDYGTSYFYRGAVTNNYVKFAGFYWRIIRVNGDGSLRIIYDGTSAYANGTSNTARSALSSVAFNSTYNDNKYVGYMYGNTSTSVATAHANTNNSTIKGQVDNWYKTNIADKGYSDAVADIQFCNDRTFVSGNGYGTSATNYAAYNRLYTNKTPQFKCPNKTRDGFTVDDTTNGNGALTYPVGLITADEISAAGGVWGTDNTKYYLYKGHWYWSLSPSSIVSM